ncbi:MAG: class GN sortase [Pseudomonadales bacterium]|nr:class GN sortase [Pseudomonadales bacterium]
MISRLLTAGLLLFGGWQLGHGAYLLAKAELAQWLLEQAWAEMQANAQRIDTQRADLIENSASGDSAVEKKGANLKPVPPWPWADTWPMAKMKWPSLNKELIVLEGASGRNLAFGPAHLSASTMPGQTGVSVIGGHRDTHFEFLQQVLIGDEFVVQMANGDEYRFQVKEIIIADVRESQIRLDSDIAKIALVACYPFSDLGAGSPLRYLVLADLMLTKKTGKVERVPPTTQKLLTTMSV